MAFGEVGTALSKIKSPAVNLADTFAFSGTVTGFDKTPLTLLSTFTSDGSDDTASFTSGIDSTYKEYMFVFNNIHPQTDSTGFQFQASINGGSGYGVNATTTYFRAYHRENGDNPSLLYEAGSDKAQSTDFIHFPDVDMGNDNDQAASGILRLYDPSSTTFVKHFVGRIQYAQKDDYSIDTYVAGYFNTTSAINAMQFKMASGEIQGGTISVFGVA